MKTLPSCICILGFAAAASVGNAEVLLDQIGPDDGTNIDLSNILANQIFEAAYAQYSISVSDEFDNPDGSPLMSVEYIMGGWNGYGIYGNSTRIRDGGRPKCGQSAGGVECL